MAVVWPRRGQHQCDSNIFENVNGWGLPGLTAIEMLSAERRTYLARRLSYWQDWARRPPSPLVQTVFNVTYFD